jgi:hypothetical protein
MAKSSKSPYLSRPGRLADVIAAIQTLATYKVYKLTVAEWAERISGDRTTYSLWLSVFEEHQEFFRFDTQGAKVSLVWRRQYPKNYDVSLERRLDSHELSNVSAEHMNFISREPLSPPDIKALIDTAINLHVRAIEMQRENRWWVPLASAVGGLVGSFVGGVLKGS